MAITLFWSQSPSPLNVEITYSLPNCPLQSLLYFAHFLVLWPQDRLKFLGHTSLKDFDGTWHCQMIPLLLPWPRSLPS